MKITIIDPTNTSKNHKAIFNILERYFNLIFEKYNQQRKCNFFLIKIDTIMEEKSIQKVIKNSGWYMSAFLSTIFHYNEQLTLEFNSVSSHKKYLLNWFNSLNVKKV